ncbi:GNAT family N-acetyltransferase [Deinococcus peraridilitoris]|uniref:N-acetyltransferase domain-containing protein n=1 Tax=Deinococcus peraridilitoris (strain DSM 19664 / LMG 22246 / CIP 109416 / KR-200) TaxID=937777 RepID=K9ZY95_DEIPD|nr:GNAT family N-acetyltransferase [Deinococcus peraridilitoris]AFZ66571.1 hypothetical protein Deipe_1007 [Deinococcus peraridilitoris DSM 19664]
MTSLRRVTEPHDPVIRAFGTLQSSAYFEPDMLIPASYIARLLEWQTPERKNFLLVAEDAALLRGGTVFHLFADLNVGFSSFLAVAQEARGQGLARRLHDARFQLLDEAAGQPVLGVFIDVVNPERLSPADFEAEAAVGSDPFERRRVFGRLGFGQVDIRYEQPVGGPGGGPVTNMDLLFCPRQPLTSLPTDLVADTMRTYWTPWLGEERARRHARELAGRAGSARELRLLPPV